MPRCAWATASVGASVGRLFEVADGLGQLSERAQRQPEVVLCLGVARLQFHGGLERRQGALRVAAQPLGHAEVILRVEQPGVQRDGSREAFARLVDMPLEAKRESQPIVRFRHARGELDRAPVGSDRLVELLPALEDDAEEVVRVRI